MTLLLLKSSYLKQNFLEKNFRNFQILNTLLFLSNFSIRQVQADTSLCSEFNFCSFSTYLAI